MRYEKRDSLQNYETAKTKSSVNLEVPMCHADFEGKRQNKNQTNNLFCSVNLALQKIKLIITERRYTK